MTADTLRLDPYQEPTAYEMLNIKKGIYATSKEIGKAYNKAQGRAKHIKSSEERAERMAQLEWAKEQLQRPENRVLVDFFLLGDDLFADLCVRCGERLAATPLPTGQVLGELFSANKYDDLVPRPLKAFCREFRLLNDLEWFENEGSSDERLSICSWDF